MWWVLFVFIQTCIFPVRRGSGRQLAVVHQGLQNEVEIPARTAGIEQRRSVLLALLGISMGLAHVLFYEFWNKVAFWAHPLPEYMLNVREDFLERVRGVLVTFELLHLVLVLKTREYIDISSSS